MNRAHRIAAAVNASDRLLKRHSEILKIVNRLLTLAKRIEALAHENIDRANQELGD